MEKEKSKIRVQDVETGQTLFECSLEQSEKAYSFAAEMEKMGLDIVVLNPTLADTLTSSLGLSNEEQARFDQSMDDEIEQHEGSCCFEDTSKNNIN